MADDFRQRDAALLLLSLSVHMAVERMANLRVSGALEDVRSSLAAALVFAQTADLGEEAAGSVSVAAARRLVLHNLEKGTHCLVCGQLCKLYSRKLYGTMAAWLIWLVQAYEKEPRWYSVNEGPVFQNRKGGGDFAKLHYWGFIVDKPNEDDPDKRTSGMWQPTPKAIEFVHQRLTVPDRVFVFDDTIYGWGDKQVLISETFSEKFSYAELMASNDFNFAHTAKPPEGEEDAEP